MKTLTKVFWVVIFVSLTTWSFAQTTIQTDIIRRTTQTVANPHPIGKCERPPDECPK